MPRYVSRAVLAEDGSVVYADSLPATDVAGQAFEDGISIVRSSVGEGCGRQRCRHAFRDPLWRDLVHTAAWRSSSDGWRLEVAPTLWARSFVGSYTVGLAGWNELYSKYRNRGLNTNLNGMKDQFICHQVLVAIREPRKATWNLDEWRPDVGWWGTVNARCNPGGAKWFD